MRRRGGGKVGKLVCLSLRKHMLAVINIEEVVARGTMRGRQCE